MNYVDGGYVRAGYLQLDSDTQGGCSFDGYGKLIFVSESVSTIDVQTIYARWKDWVRIQHDAEDTNLKWAPAMRYSGSDPIPGGFTGATFFMMNGWRLVFNPNTTALSGVLFSEDFPTAYWNYALAPIFPVSVSAVVNQVTTTQNIVSGDPASIAAAVLAQILASVVPANIVQGQDSVADAVWAKPLP
jgi:hypothetical protein